MEKVNIREALASVKEHWSQKIIGEANGQFFKVAKGNGEINWHKHDDQDELFILYKGHLTLQLRDKNVDRYEDEMFIVAKGLSTAPEQMERWRF